MSRWMMLMSVGMLVLATSCGGSATPTPPTATQPAITAPVATTVVATTTAPAATSAPVAATATAAKPADTTTPVATTVAAPTTAPEATSAPVAATATAAKPAATPTANSIGGGNFTPKVRSVWNTAVGLDQMHGSCPKGSMLPVYGLVQITPNGDTLAWKNQEPAPYTMAKLQPNTYQYAGPSAIKDGVVTMTVKFLSDKTLEMNRVFVANADPACMHTHVYTGTYQWDKP